MINRPRLLAILLCLFAGSAAQAQFLPYREFRFTGQPSNTYLDSLGLLRTHGVYEDQVTGGTPPVKKNLMESTARSTRASYTLHENRMFYDIEYLDTDSFRVGRTTAIANAESLAKYIGWAKSAEPTLEVGLYSTVPITDLYISSRLAQRQSADNLIQVLADSVDYLLPSIYLYFSEAKRSYASYAVPMVAEARRMAKGKKVIAFITPGYHPSGDYPNQYASYSVWMNVLKVIKDDAKADGFMIFGGVGAMGSQYSDWARIDTSGWWRATKDFLAALKGGGTAPAAPSVVTPGQGAIIDPPSFTARWRKSAGATNYHLQLAENSNFLNPVVNDSSLTDSMRVVSSLKSGTTYYIRVRAKGVYGSSSYSTTVQFSTSIPPPPAAPSVVTPQQGAVVNPPSFTARWRKTTGAQTYHLQLAETATFSNPLISDSTLTDTLRSVSGLKTGTTYYVHVRAKGTSSWSAFGATVQFSTSTPPPAAPSLIAPAAGAIVDPPTVTTRWLKVTGAIAYQIQLASSATFSSLLLNDSTLTDTMRVLSSLQNGTTYYIRARAKGNGGWSSYSSSVQFATTTPPPAVPVPITPAQGAVLDPAAPTARWHRVTGAVNYHVQLSENSTFQSLVLNDSTLADTLRQIGTLKSGTIYYFRLRARGVSYWSVFSTVVQFSTSTPPLPATPVMVTPGQGTIIAPPSFTARWRKATDATSYHLQLAENNTFQSVVVNDSTLADTTRQVTGLKSGTTYYIRLRAKGVSGWGNFGTVVQFSTSTPPPLPAAPTLIAPIAGSTVDSPSFIVVWHRVTGVVRYHLQLAENAIFQTPLINDSTVTDTTRQVGPLRDGTTYYVRVRATGTSGWGNYGSTVQFSTSARPPAAPSLLTPDPGAIVDPPTITARWGKVNGAILYHVQVTESTVENALVNDSTLADTLRMIGSLKAGTMYSIRLRSKGIAGWSGYTNTFPFSTSSPIFVSVSTEKPTQWYLAQNFPNPFNPTTTIRFALREASSVRLNVYNALGELVRQLVQAELTAGVYDVRFDGSGLPSGVYIYRIQAGGFTGNRRLLLVK